MGKPRKISKKCTINDLYNSCLKLKSDFPAFFAKVVEKHDISLSNMSEMNDEYISICCDLLFGVDENSYDKNKKIYLNKYKNLVKTILWHKIVVAKSDALGLLSELVILIEEFTNHIATEYNNIIRAYIHDDGYLELDDISDLFFSFAWDSTHMRNEMSVLKTLAYNYIFNPTTIKLCKKDSLKRYYFNHVYGLKNNIKIFDEEKLPFGATNQIMKKYDNIIEYVFTDFIAAYQSITTILSNLKDKY